MKTKVSLTKKLTTLLIFAILIPFIILTYIEYNHSKELIKTEIKNSLISSIQEKKHTASKYMHRIKKDAQLLGKNSKFIDAFINKDFNLDNFINENVYMYYDLLLIDTSGNIKYAYKKESDLGTNIISKDIYDNQLSEVFNKSLKSDEVAVSDFTHHKDSKNISLFVSKRIKHNGKTVGVLALQLDVREMLILIGSSSSKDILFGLYNSNKKDIDFLKFFSDDTKNPIFRTISIPSAKNRPMGDALEKKNGSGEYLDYKENRVISAWGYLDEFKTGIVIKSDTSEEYSQIDKLMFAFIIEGLIIAIAIFVTIIIVVRLVNKFKEKSKQYQYAVDGTSDGIWDWNLINNKVYFSPRWKEMLGYRDEELENLFDAFESKLHPDDKEELFNQIEICKKDKNAPFDLTIRLRHKDGHWVWIWDRANIIFDKNSKAIRMVGFHTDITKTKELGNKLEEQVVALNEAQKISKLGSYSSDLTINKTIATDELYHIFGLEKQSCELTYEVYFEFIHPDDKVMIQNTFDNALSTKKGYEIEHRIITTDKKTLYCNDIVNFGLNKDGEIVKIYGTLQDITQQKLLRLENEENLQLLMQQSKMASMGEMMESIAHQWRQPLSVISTASSGMKMQKEFGMIDDNNFNNSCDSITKSANHLSDTIDDFRNFFKEEKVKKYFNIEDMLNKTMRLLISKFKNKEIEIIENIEKVQMYGFGNELVQAFMNILNNARDELETKQQRRLIFVDIYQENDTAIIKIKDNAGGIPTDIIDKVFDSYFTTKEDKDGTGIGLYMSKKIILNSFQGSIEANNITYAYDNIEYTGAEFTIKLPVTLD